MENPSVAQAWRVICEDGKVRALDVRRLACDGMPGASGVFPWHAECAEVGGTAVGRTPREAVQSIVRMAFWTPVEILAPGEKTREEAVAEAVKAEREACANLCEADAEYGCASLIRARST
jgi:hypothetical protein